MLKRFCDICECEIKEEHLDAGQYSMRLGQNNYDLCEECFKDIKKHISEKHRVIQTKKEIEYYGL